MYWIILLILIVLLAFKNFLIQILFRNKIIQNFCLDLFNFFIKLYTIIQIWYNHYYNKYLKELFKKNTIYNYYIISSNNFQIVSFDTENKEYEIISDNKLIIKEIIDNDKKSLYANIFDKCNKDNFKSTILGASFKYKINDKLVEIDITEFLQSFVKIKDADIYLLKKFYEIKFPNTLKDFDDNNLEKITLLNEDLTEFNYDNKITYY